MGRIDDPLGQNSGNSSKRIKLGTDGLARHSRRKDDSTDKSDDEVVFIKTETLPRTAPTQSATRGFPKAKNSLSMSKGEKRSALVMRQNSSTSSVQKSLADFWKLKPSDPTPLVSPTSQPVSTSTAAAAAKTHKKEVEIVDKKLCLKIGQMVSSKSQTGSSWKSKTTVEAHVVSSSSTVPDETAAEEINQETAALKFKYGESQAGSSYFDDDSSGDEIISNVPDSLFSETSSTASYESESTLSVDHQLRIYTSKIVKSQKVSSSAGRKCPFYKLMPGTPFSVDAFNFGVIPNVAAYYLSHFHSDHYGGMTKSFSRPLYCSEITARLVARKIGVDSQWINPIAMNTPVIVDGVEVTLLEANHCPGSVLFLFKLKDGRVYLHTGDFRADPKVLGEDPHLRNLREISKIYLDTTYLDPYYEFPSQEETIQFAADVALEHFERNPRVLICCGTYSVGKERIFMRIAEVLKCKVAVTQYKLDLLNCFGWEDLNEMLTKDWNSAQVHVLPMRALDLLSLEEHLAKFKNYTEVLAFVPSGWQFNKKLCSLRDIKPKKRGPVSVYGVPYSEHSSYKELEWFVRFMKPKEIIPTVNVGNPKTRKKMKEHLDLWLDPKSKPATALKQNSIKQFFAREA